MAPDSRHGNDRCRYANTRNSHPRAGRRADGSVDGILSGADVEHSKPAPDCFLEAMRREGCTPQETLIFEDSANRASRRPAAAERPISG